MLGGQLRDMRQLLPTLAFCICSPFCTGMEGFLLSTLVARVVYPTCKGTCCTFSWQVEWGMLTSTPVASLISPVQYIMGKAAGIAVWSVHCSQWGNQNQERGWLLVYWAWTSKWTANSLWLVWGSTIQLPNLPSLPS